MSVLSFFAGGRGQSWGKLAFDRRLLAQHRHPESYRPPK
jgi:hypothetical protein